MRKFIAFFVENPLFCDILTLAGIVIGIVSLFLIRREVFPNVEFDIIRIDTRYPGASAEQVEKLVTNPIEQALKEVDGLKKVNSGTVDGTSGIIVTLDPDQTNAKKGKDDIENAIDRLTSLPEEIDEPIVTEIQSKNQPLIEVSLAGNLSPLELRAQARRLEDELELIPGVAQVIIRGLRKQEVRVEVSLRQLQRYRISLEDVIVALKKQNLLIPGGKIEADGHQSLEQKIRTTGDFTNIDDIKRTVIRANDLGEAVTLGAIAKVYEDLEPASILTKTNGEASLNLTVLKKERSDAIDLVDRLKVRMEEIKGKIDPRVSVSYVNDLSQYVRRRLSIITGNFAIGLALVLLLLPLMLPFRFALLIGLGEPFAFLGAIALLFFGGASINLILMIGLIIVSGILVDDSTVVVENAVRLIEGEGKSPREAAIDGTLQIMPPVMASIMTTSFAFLPMLLMTGIMGKFIRQVPIGVLTCLFMSAIETFLILPGHVAHWIQAKHLQQPGSNQGNWFFRALEWSRSLWDRAIVPPYLSFLKLTLRWRYVTAAAMGILFILTMGWAVKGMKFVLFPPDGVEIFMIRTEMPTGSSLEMHLAGIEQIEKRLLALPKEELENFVSTVGIQQKDPNDPFTKRGSEYGQIIVYLTPEDKRTRKAIDVMDALRKEIGTPSNFVSILFERMQGGPPQGKPISVSVQGDEYTDILPLVEKIKAILKTYPGVTDLGDSYTLGKEELKVKIRPEDAAATQLSVSTIGNAVRAAFEGIIATSIRTLNEEIDVRVSLPRDERATEQSLRNLMIPNSTGNLTPLHTVATISKGRELLTFEHYDNKREVKVSGEVDTDVTTAREVNLKLAKEVAGILKDHPKVRVRYLGENEDTAESFASLGRAFLLSFIGIFLVLILTFKRLLQPLLVLLTIPLGMIGVIWAFTLHGMPMSFMGSLGVVALSGIIVNNAIVFVDFVNQARRQGLDAMASIIEAARIRVRPIFLTTITTVVGVLPTAYGIGGLDKFVVPIAMALGWGLLFGALLTAFVFPSALAILDDIAALGRRFVPRIATLYDSH